MHTEEQIIQETLNEFNEADENMKKAIKLALKKYKSSDNPNYMKS